MMDLLHCITTYTYSYQSSLASNNPAVTSGIASLKAMRGQERTGIVLQFHSPQKTSAGEIPIPHIATLCIFSASRTCKLVKYRSDWQSYTTALYELGSSVFDLKNKVASLYI